MSIQQKAVDIRHMKYAHAGTMSIQPKDVDIRHMRYAHAGYMLVQLVLPT